MAESNLPKFHEAIAVSHTVLASKFHYFVFENSEPFVFLPGQFINVKVLDKLFRAYSIAGGEGGNRFGLLIDISPGGPGSKFFENLKEGDKITYLGPSGVFISRPDENIKHVLFLGTGSGVSPLKCMIESLLREKGFTKPITLYFGLRYEEDIFWREAFQKLAGEFLNFGFKIVLSKPDGTWQGETGHITNLVNKDFPNVNEYAAYLCGNKAMINEAVNILTLNGCQKEKIYSEEF